MAFPWAYFDTSVLVKRYVAEAGSSRAQSLLRRHRFVSSAIAPLEAISALCRRQASGDLSPRNFAAVLARIQRDRLYWELVEVTALVLERAENLVRQANVRALDSIHLASAVTFQAASGIRLRFITADSRQRRAAGTLGLEFIWVGG